MVFSIARCAWLTASLTCILNCYSVQPSHAQPIPHVVQSENNLNDLRSYYRDRLVQIVVSYMDTTGASIDEKGTGFIVSPAGDIMTARHVFEALYKPGVTVRSKKIYKLTDKGRAELRYVEDSAQGSERADIMLFKVENDTNSGFPYMCIDRKNTVVDYNSKVTVAAFQALEGRGWKEQIHFEAPVTQVEGPDALAQRWAVGQQFLASMSGGAVLVDGRVVGVVTVGLGQEKKQIDEHNYVSPLKIADEVNWQSRAIDCRPAIVRQTDWTGPLSQSAFFAQSDEGTIAWLPTGRSGLYFAASTKGNYVMPWSDLRCTGKCNCARGERTVRLVVNHRMKNACPYALAVEDGTFYGAQVLPVFKDYALENPTTWLYRNRTLFRKTPEGAFIEQSGSAKTIQVPYEPSRFNSFHDDEGQETLDDFDQFALGWPWHGHPRGDERSHSTWDKVIGFRNAWRLPRSWLDQDVEIKNWILRYRGTDSETSSSPVDWEFCVTNNWKSFRVRAWSPERCVEPSNLEVYLLD